MVGEFNGNPNTVMPLENSGFIEAMAAAVYSATVAAMNSAQPQGGASGDIYMDGQKVGEVVDKAKRRAAIGSGLVAVTR